MSADRQTFVGRLEKRGRFTVAEPFFERGRRVTVKQERQLRHGQLAELRLTSAGQARVIRRLGSPDRASDVIEGLMIDRGLARSFPADVESAATQQTKTDVSREDLRDLATFTIDPSSAQDFDDAISAEKLDDGALRVWVHIADVSAYVRPDSPIDREAYRRGTSVYVPGAVEPMLPQALSNGTCSLVPGEERLAVTVEFELYGPEVRRCAYYRSLICSDARLDYEQVDRVFAGKESAQDPWARPLEVARAAAALLADTRARHGALLIESPDPQFTFDSDGNVEEMHLDRQTESHELIEQLMITANEQVALLLERSGTPTLYRTHEYPDPDRIESLVAQLDSLGVPTPPLPERFGPQQAAELSAEISHEIDRYVRRHGHGRDALTSLLLRAQKPALYSPKCVGHAGLHLTHYCHFTSPIRRYPDLVCHRALLAQLSAGEQRPHIAELSEAGSWLSEREREAMLIERDADDIAACFLLERELRERGAEWEWEGEVIGLIAIGAFIRFGSGYEGLMHVRKLGRREWWELNEHGTILCGSRSGTTLRLGDPVRVQVERVDAPRGRTDLLPVTIPSSA